MGCYLTLFNYFRPSPQLPSTAVESVVAVQLADRFRARPNRGLSNGRGLTDPHPLRVEEVLEVRARSVAAATEPGDLLEVIQKETEVPRSVIGATVSHSPWSLGDLRPS